MNEAQNENAQPETGRVVVFASQPQQITQPELAEERRLSLEISAREQQREVLRTRIRCALHRGCPVEPGIFRAELIHRTRRGYAIPACEYDELVIE
ncbi:MAG: hypothetical protein L0212_03265 [Acidobacteria bacterium]|nr:hypothetical protein [Acidobacteriota bacterium]